MNDVAYAYKNTSDVLDECSSGGAFVGIVSALKKMTRGEFAVYGAEWDDCFNVIHGRAQTEEECIKFCGSKYVQSNLGDCFITIEDDLKNGLTVLFTGTPCQISALKKYLHHKDIKTEKLLLVDIVCHGVTQQRFWKDYIQWLEKREKAKLIEFSFRYKRRGWKGYPVLAVFENGKRYENSFKASHYINIYRKGLLMRESCFNCRYPGAFESDITIGDFWGIEACMPEIPVSGGVSVVICHSEKGKQIATLLNDERQYLKQTPNDQYLNYNHNLKHKTSKPELYEQFWLDYKNRGIDYVLKRYGDNSVMGMIKFYFVRFIRDTGVLTIVKNLLGRV